MSGDFTQRARARQYKDAAAFMRRLPTPQLVVPGNHDIPLYDVFRRFFFPLRNYHKYITKRPAARSTRTRSCSSSASTPRGRSR